MSRIGNLTGLLTNKERGVNPAFTPEQLAIKSELYAIADASRSDILAKVQQIAPDMLLETTSRQQQQDRSAALKAAELARTQPVIASVAEISPIRAADQPENPDVAAKLAQVYEVFDNVAA